MTDRDQSDPLIFFKAYGTGVWDSNREVYDPKPCHESNLSKSMWPSGALLERHGVKKGLGHE